MTPSGRQIRAARSLAGWERTDLAKKAGLSSVTVRYIENETNSAKKETIEKIIQVFNEVGIEFIENEGVRRRPEGVEIFQGSKRFDDFYDFLYEHLKHLGGDVCVGNSDPRLYIKYCKGAETHKKRMEELVAQGKIRFRILIQEGNQSFFSSSYAEYKWQPQNSFVPTSFYAFGECLALVSFVHQPAPYVILIKSGPLAEAYRQSFNIAWEQAKTPIITGEQ